MVKREPIAIVGITALFPGSIDGPGFWQDIIAGRDLITDVPPHYWLVDDYYDSDPAAEDKTYVTRGAFLTPVPFNALDFGVPPTALPSTDISQLLALIAARRVLQDAACGREAHVPRERIAVYLGVAATTWAAMIMAARLQRPIWTKALRESGLQESVVQAVCDRIAASYTPIRETTFPGILSNVVAGRVANRFDLGGGNFTVDAACASSLAAVSVAMNDLYLHNADMVITGGVDALSDIQMYICFSKTPALSATGDCRPFSAGADGTMIGEGLGLFALRRLSDAERDGDKIYAVIRGIGSSSDGLAKSVYAPRPEGQMLALERAYAAAGYGPGTVELVEAHGTATVAGDAAEFEALRQVFGRDRPDEHEWCALGSIKSQIGHTKGAAGSAGLFKAALALHHKTLPPTIKVERPNPKLDIKRSPFYLNTEARPWIASGGHPRRASVSSFGFGGTNFHLTLEEYLGTARYPQRWNSTPTELVAISGETPDEILTSCRLMLQQSSAGGYKWKRVAGASRRTFDARKRIRVAFVVSSSEDLSGKVETVSKRLQSGSSAAGLPGIQFADCKLASPPPVAVVFAGQGSQFVGMGKHLTMTFPFAQTMWDRAEPILSKTGVSLRSLVFPPPVFDEQARARQREDLTATEAAQPALAVQGLLHLALVREIGIHPRFAIGHSFGELLALHAAGVFSEADLLRVARTRGELMAATGRGVGAMTAISTSAEVVEQKLREWKIDVVIANYNSPVQTVVSGSISAIEVLESRCADSHLSYHRLPVSAAFHSPLIAGSVEPFRKSLDAIEMGAPQIEVLSNADARPYPDDPEAIRQKLADQLRQPVRFVEQIEELHLRGARVFIECGAGSSLSSLIARILDGREHVCVSLERKDAHGLTSMWEALAKLAVAGLPIEFSKLQQAFAPPPDEVTTPNSGSVFLLDGAPYGKPYPPRGGKAALPPPNPKPIEHVQPDVPNLPEPSSPVTKMRNNDEDRWSEIYRQIEAAQKATQQAILDTHSLTLSSLERLANGDHDAATDYRLTGVEVERNVPANFDSTSPAARAQADVMQPPPSTYDAQVSHEIFEPVIPQNGMAQIAGRATVPDKVVPTPPTSKPTQSLLLEVVSDKTGYPVDVLDLDVELEAGLGIDSIKRVEIFSALQQRQPDLPEVTPERMGSLRTLRQIIRFLDEDGTHSPAPLVSAKTPKPTIVAKTDVDALLLQVVSEKTGYPLDVLDLDMELEAGLGIDSIKRVEIFSAVQQRQPNLPQVSPEQMGSLRTLRQVIQFLDNADPQAAVHSVEKQPGTKIVSKVQRLELVSVPATGSTPDGSGFVASGSFSVIDDGADGIARLLVEKLRQKEVSVELVTSVPTACSSLIFVAGFPGATNAVDAHLRFLHLLQTIGTHSQPSSLVVITNADDSEDAASVGGIAAMARTASLESPSLSVKIVGIEARAVNRDRIADAVVGEILNANAQREVVLDSNGRRTTWQLQPSEVGSRRNKISSDSVLVISGGARGVTATCLIELARVCHPKLAILGRTSLEISSRLFIHPNATEAEIKQALLDEAKQRGIPVNLPKISYDAAEILAAREVQTTMSALREAGAEAMYLTCDISDSTAVAAALETVRRKWGRITGLVHAAGVLADKLIPDKTDEQFRRVFSTKVGGWKALLDATATDHLDVIATFSSIASLYGNAGQCDYAAANAVLNRLANMEASRRDRACRVVSLIWGPWEGGMVSAGLANQFKARGVELIPPAQGAISFVDELLSDSRSTQVVLVAGSEPARYAEGLPRSLAVTNGTGEKTSEIVVNATTYPELATHCIKGQPVIPVVMVMEWFHRAAEKYFPERQVVQCDDLRVLRGIPLPQYEGVGHHLSVALKPVSDSLIECELRSPTGQLHYSAKLRLQEGRAAAIPIRRLNGREKFVLPEEARKLYGKRLFHGADFQVIHSLESLDANGGKAKLAGVGMMGWPSGPWHIEAAALDGALQIAILWGIEHLGRACLPTRVGRHIQHAPPPESGLLNCTVSCRRQDHLSIVSDVHLADSVGQPIAELRELEMHALPE